MFTAHQPVFDNNDETSADVLNHVIRTAGQIIFGKEHVIRLSLACILARGHLLIEDVPGVGKTTLAQTLAHVLGLSFQRIQFTSDLLPADILGVSVYKRESEQFSFHRGPIFAQSILADEVNRSTPRTQSALLEAMEEYQVTIEGSTYQLPDPFFVIATQNPSHQIGTFPLPESQLDRFLMCVGIGYPDTDAERAILTGGDRREILSELPSLASAEQVVKIQQEVREVHASEALLDYLQDLLHYSRRCGDYENGLSPRAGLALLRAAKAWALLEGRTHVLPEDVQTVLPNVVAHRLKPIDSQLNLSSEMIAEQFLRVVPIP